MINIVIAVFFVAAYAYQVVYLFVGLFKKPGTPQAVWHHRIAVLICARNEEAVISQLLASIRQQTYPAEYVDTYVAADNCTDSTADVARKAGACVYERFNRERVGKGYALEFLLECMERDDRIYDAYLILDADNLLDEHYIEEMNKMLSGGHRIITSYRNSKNYDSNWISAGYSLWFLRESRYLNQARMSLGTSCAVSGTGFMVCRDIIERNGGWKHFLLTEDIEFTVDSILHGEKVAYCKDAVLYDEQPVTFAQSWCQRTRWAKGNLQVFEKYGRALGRRLDREHSFACFDMLMTIMPAVILSLICCAVNAASVLLAAAAESVYLEKIIAEAGFALGNVYLTLFLMGFITVLTEWKKIQCGTVKKILYSFTFPVFMLTYIPITAFAIFRKVEWKPIRHDISKSLKEVRMRP